MTAPADWVPHHRDDGELLGWIRPEADLWVPVDRLGRALTDAAEWLDAEAALETRGLAWLADPWLLDGEGDAPRRVRIAEVSTDGVVVDTDTFGAVDAPFERFRLPWPAPARLRPPRAGERLPGPWG